MKNCIDFKQPTGISVYIVVSKITAFSYDRKSNQTCVFVGTAEEDCKFVFEGDQTERILEMLED